MGFAPGIGKELDEIITEQTGNDRLGYNSPIVEIDKLKDSGGIMSYDDIKTVFPKVTSVIETMESAGMSADDAFKIIKAGILHRQWAGKSLVEISDELGITQEAIEKVKYSIKAKNDELFNRAGIDKDRLKTAYYYDAFFGVNNPKLVYDNFDEFDRKYKSLPEKDRLKYAQNKGMLFSQKEYEEWIENNKLSPLSLKILNRVAVKSKQSPLYDAVVKPVITTAWRFAGSVEGILTGQAKTQWDLMAEAIEDQDMGKFEWAFKQVLSAGVSMGLYVGINAMLRASLMGLGAMGGPIGMVVAGALSLGMTHLLEVVSDSRDVYNEVYKKTGDHEYALSAATKSGFVEAMVTLPTAKLGIFGTRAGQSFWKRFIKSGIGESVQEGLQGYVTTTYSEELPIISREAFKAAITDFLVTLPTAGLIGAVTTNTEATVKKAGLEGYGELFDSVLPEMAHKTDEQIVNEFEGNETPAGKIKIDEVSIPDEITLDGLSSQEKVATAQKEVETEDAVIPKDVAEALSAKFEEGGKIKVDKTTKVKSVVNKIVTDEYIKNLQTTIDEFGLELKIDRKTVKKELKKYIQGQEVNPVLGAIFDLQIFGGKNKGLDGVTIAEINKLSKKRTLHTTLKTLYQDRHEAVARKDRDAVKRIEEQIRRVIGISVLAKEVNRSINKINKSLSDITKVAKSKKKSNLSVDIATNLAEITKGFNAAKNTKMDPSVKASFLERANLAVEWLSNNHPDVFGDFSPMDIVRIIEKPSVDTLTYKELDILKKFIKNATDVGKVEREKIISNIENKAATIINDTLSRLFHPTKIADGLKNMALERGVTPRELAQYIKEKTGKTTSTSKLVEIIREGETDANKDVLDAVRERLKLKKDESLMERIIQYAMVPGGKKKAANKIKEWFSVAVNFPRLGEFITGSPNSPLAKALGYDIVKAEGIFNNNMKARLKWFLDTVRNTYGDIKHLADKMTIEGVAGRRDMFITMYLYARQPDGFRALVEDNGYDPEFLQKLPDHLSEKDKRFADVISKELMSHFDEIQKATFIRTGIVITPEEYYFRMMRLSSRVLVDGSSINDPFVLLAETDYKGAQRTSIEKARTESGEPRSPLSLELSSIYSATVQLQERIKAFSEPIAVFNKLLNSKEFVTAVQAVYGKQMIEVLKRYRDITLNSMTMYDRGAIATMLRTLRHFRALNVLVGNAISVARQFPSIVLTLPYCNARGLSIALSKMMSNPIETWKAVMEMSPTVANRSFNIAFREAKTTVQYSNNKLKKWIARFEQIGMSPQAAVDAAAVVIGWLAMYESAKLTMTEEQAREYADMNIVKTQPQGEATKLNWLRTGGGPGGEVLRNFTLFTNQLTQNFNIMINDIPVAFREGNPALATKLIAAQLVTAAFIAALGAEIEDIGEAGWEIFSNLVKVIPLAGPVMSSAISGYNFRSSYSGFDIFYDIGYVVEAMKDEDNEKLLKGLKKLFFNNAPLPGVAIRRIQKFAETEDLADLIGYKKAQ